MQSIREALALSAPLLLAPIAPADVLWTTDPGMPSPGGTTYLVGPSALSTSHASEAADDFNAIGSVERVRTDGYDCQSCFGTDEVLGVTVRFYEWTAAGPGALLQAQTLDADDPRFQWTMCCGPAYLEIDLPQPFQASGWHFVSVQVLFVQDGTWSFKRRNVGATQGGPAFFRDGAGAWAPFHLGVGWPPVDVSLQLEGTPGGTPEPTILSAGDGPVHPSSRVEIAGSGFGASQGTSRVLVAGAEAIVTQWTDAMIVAYVPESTPTGTALLELEQGGQVVDTHKLVVEPRAQDGRVLWRFEVDADSMTHRPGLAPDGSVYANDLQGRLYKLAPDGGLEWVRDSLRGQVGNGAEGTVAVDPTGRAYVVANPLGPKVELVAYDPDGTLAWVFTDPDALSALAGPAVGPDGNVYVAFHGPAGPSLGLCSLTPGGALRWTNAGAPLFYEEGGLGVELVFGSSQLGGPLDQVHVAPDMNGDGRLFAFDLATGAQRWAVPKAGGTESYFLQFQCQPGTGPDGTIYVTEFIGAGLGWGLQAFAPEDGDRTWRFDPGIGADASGPVVGADGTIYFGWDISRVSAVAPDGTERWRTLPSDGVRTAPSISPDDALVLVGGGGFGVPGSLQALSAASGLELWRIDLPEEPSGADLVPDARPRFTPDSRRAYLPVSVLADAPAFPSCYLYAIRTGDAPFGSR